MIDVSCELSWGYRQVLTFDFSTWLRLLIACWSECSHDSPLTAGFLEAVALPPSLFFRAVIGPAQIPGNGKTVSTSWWGVARAHYGGALMGDTRAAIFGSWNLLQPSSCSNVRAGRDHCVWKALWEGNPPGFRNLNYVLGSDCYLKEKLTEKHIYLILVSWGKHFCKYQVPKRLNMSDLGKHKVFSDIGWPW